MPLENTSMNISMNIFSSYLNSPRIAALKNVIFILFVYTYVSRIINKLAVQGVSRTLWDGYRLIGGMIFRAITKAPGASRKIQAEMDKAIKHIEEKVASRKPGEPRYLALPDTGLEETKLKQELVRLMSRLGF